MRECRSSGSVEGVMGNHDSYSDSQARKGSPALGVSSDGPWDSQTGAEKAGPPYPPQAD